MRKKTFVVTVNEEILFWIETSSSEKISVEKFLGFSHIKTVRTQNFTCQPNRRQKFNW